MDTAKSQGYFRLETIKDGKVLQDSGWLKNLGMTARLPVIAGLYGSVDAQTAFTYLAVGTDSTAPSAGQTTLGAELTTLGLGRAAATVSRVTTNSTNDTTQLQYTWTATGNTTVKEVGYLNAASGGVMGGRALTTDMTLSNGIQLRATYKIVHT